MTYLFQQLMVLQDVCTRWNSSLIMIQRILLILPAMMAALCGTDHQHLLPDVSKTKDLQDLQRLLEPFEIATKQVSSQKVPTASLILPIMHKLVNYTLGELATDSTMITKAKKAIKT